MTSNLTTRRTIRRKRMRRSTAFVEFRADSGARKSLTPFKSGSVPACRNTTHPERDPRALHAGDLGDGNQAGAIRSLLRDACTSKFTALAICCGSRHLHIRVAQRHHDSRRAPRHAECWRDGGSDQSDRYSWLQTGPGIPRSGLRDEMRSGRYAGCSPAFDAGGTAAVHRGWPGGFPGRQCGCFNCNSPRLDGDDALFPVIESRRGV